MPDFQRFAATQRKLYDRAHHASHELKPLGFEIQRAGLNTSRYYLNPDFMSLPFEDCEILGRLTAEQVSVVTAYFYAQLYAHVMNGEIDVVQHNARAADLLFERASDEWTDWRNVRDDV